VKQAVRHAAQEQTCDRRLSARADNDEIRPGIRRSVRDRVSGASRGRFQLLVGCLEPRGFQVFDLGLKLLLDLLFVGLYRVATAATDRAPDGVRWK